MKENAQARVMLSTGTLFHMSLDRIFKIAQSAGFKYLELMLRSKEEIAQSGIWNSVYIKQLSQEYGLKVISLHSPIDFELSTHQSNYLKETIEIAKALGVEHIIVHSPKRFQETYCSWFYLNIIPLIRSSPVKILIENMGTDCVFRTAEDFGQFSHLCLDIAHETGSSGKISDTVRALSNIEEFHVSWGTGINFHLQILGHENFFQEILALHPKAWRTIEMQPKAFADRENDQSIIENLRKTREFLESF